MKLAEKTPLIDNVVFVNGLTRSGKFFFSKIVCGFDKMEHFLYVPQLDQLAFLERLGSLDKNTATVLLRSMVDYHALNLRLGRDLNFRRDDASSLENSYEKELYLKRAAAPVNQNIVGEINSDGRNSVFLLHESLPQIALFLNAFPKLKWLNISRHPIDLVHSWYLRGWGHRFIDDPLSFTPVIATKDSPVPWYFFERQEEYASLTQMDRIINSIAILFDLEQAAYAALPANKKEQVMLVNYENLLEKTETEVKRLGDFLKVNPSKNLPSILAKEGCPKVIPAAARKKKKQTIKELASPEIFELLNFLVSEYEKRK